MHTRSFAVLAFSAVMASGMAFTQSPSNSGISDAVIEANVLRAINADTSLQQEPIDSSTAFGVVTLTGAVSDESARDKVESIVSRTNGVKRVVDQLSVGANAVATASAAKQKNGAQPVSNDETDPAAANTLPDPANDPQASATAAQTGPVNGNQDPNSSPQPLSSGNSGGTAYDYPLPSTSGDTAQSTPQQYPNNQPYPNSQPQSHQGRIYRRDYERMQAQQGNGQIGPYSGPQGYAQSDNSYTGRQGGQIGGQQVTVAPGTVLSVRINRWLSSGDAQPGSTFTALVNNDIVAGGQIAIPRGAEVQGTVIGAKGAGVLKGRGELTLQLTGLSLGGQQIPLTSEPFTVTGHDKAARSINSTIAGGALGAVIGAIAGGGPGAAIGAGVGGAAGLGASAASGGGQAYVPEEALLRFRLTTPVSLITVSEGEMQRLGNYAGPAGARRPLPPPGYGYGPGPYPYGYPYAGVYYGRPYRYYGYWR